MKAKASICISEDATLIESLEIAKSRIQIMIDKGMDNKNQVLQGLIDKANKRIAEIQSGEKPALRPDANAKYYAEVVVDLDQIAEPMIADPDVNNADVSKDIHTIPSDHYLITVATRKLTLASSVLVWFTKAI
jgi:aconitate hydratase 2/2-methylisocitrate dehydratase